ncbi:MAG TPA: hypothetical protein VKB93_26960 [Thermoanaerobaculia bacterium]|nr:hypothetical protein [Thermoanaerobaculia bacterium]
MILVLALVTATFSPPAPTVGDPITITFSEPVKIEKSPSYEILSGAAGFSPPRPDGGLKPAAPQVVVVRTFVPKPFTIAGVTIPVRSVLKKNDDLKPAPLAAPQALPYPRAPFSAIAIAALLSILTWTMAWMFSRRRRAVVPTPLSSAERYRRAVLALRESSRHAHRWAALADATRGYLAEARANLGSDLTTTELVPRLQEGERVVAEILRIGDMEKFSREGAPPRDFDEVADRALELAS